MEGDEGSVHDHVAVFSMLRARGFVFPDVRLVSMMLTARTMMASHDTLYWRPRISLASEEGKVRANAVATLC
eukprot:47294-Eustigmatos_ZCMA.PRE.1